VMPELAEWDSFYLIVGSTAAALIGLQFIFMTLIAGSGRRPGLEAGAAFGTPTIVHFCVVLFIGAVLRAPWKTITPAALVCALTGLIGTGYILVVARRMKEQTSYEPEPEDWVFYALLPLAGYILLTVASFASLPEWRWAFFGIGLAELMLLFIGIRNSWDSASYHVLARRSERKSPASKK